MGKTKKLLERNVIKAIERHDFARIEALYDSFGLFVCENSSKDLVELMSTHGRVGEKPYDADEFDGLIQTFWKAFDSPTKTAVYVAQHLHPSFLVKMLDDGVEPADTELGNNILHGIAGSQRQISGITPWLDETIRRYPFLLNKRNSDGFTPSDIAIMTGKTETLFRMRQAGGEISPPEVLLREMNPQPYMKTSVIDRWWSNARIYQDSPDIITQAVSYIPATLEEWSAFCVDMASTNRFQTAIKLCNHFGKNAFHVFYNRPDSEMPLLDACLYAAARSGQQDGVNIFLKHGADILCGNVKDNSPLSFFGRDNGGLLVGAINAISNEKLQEQVPKEKRHLIDGKQTLLDYFILIAETKKNKPELKSFIESQMLKKKHGYPEERERHKRQTI